MNAFLERARNSRWVWFLKGLPSIPRARAMFQVRRYTMTNPARCLSLWGQCQDLFNRNVPGCLVECGVWRGGSAAVMALAMRHARARRPLHLFDSFEGLPEPTEVDGRVAREYSGGRASGALASVGQCKAGLEEVQRYLLNRLGFDPAQVHFHVGWFQQTVPADAKQLGPIALLRLDGDWYESTQICLEHLYPHLAKGGLIVLDDYFDWAGCKKATDEYRQKHGIEAPIHRIDSDAVFWINQ